MPKQDMLTGGCGTYAIDVNAFYQYWMPCQQTSVHPYYVDSYKTKIQHGSEILAPLLQSIDFDNDKICIRTLDGRHRIAAAKESGVSIIHVRMSEKLYSQIQEIFPGVILNLKSESACEKNEEKEEDTYLDDLAYFKNFFAKQKKMGVSNAPQNKENFTNTRTL
ncbi:hypothetical protein [Legionella sp. W05-934-2]|jgi:hypothetical protein|uniref:hypothetical protein n=1 Tax=Legionella sp. W05-934-2 TaxID=1198649 RepID=UPI003463338C